MRSLLISAPNSRTYEQTKSLQAYNHMPTSCVRRLVHPEIWREYYIFCVERNPVAKVLSCHRWLGTQQRVPPINEFVRSGRHALVSDFGLYTESGQMLVDRVYPYERLASWWPAVCEKLGLSDQLELPAAKSSSSQNQEPFNDQSSLQIAVDFAREIRLFGYPDPEINKSEERG